MPLAKAPPPYGQGLLGRGRGMWYCRAVACRADWHTFPSERLMRYMQSYLPIGDRVSVVPHIALGCARGPRTESDKFRLCHAGALAGRCSEALLEGVRLFKSSGDSDRRVQVRLIGAKSPMLEAQVAERGLQDSVYLGPSVAYQDAMRELAVCSVGMVVEAALAEGIFLPSKFVDIVQAGRPVLAISPAQGTLADCVRAWGGGVCADNTDVHSIHAAISRLYDAWRDGSLDARYGPERLAAEFGEERVVGRIAEIVGRIAGRR